jgi:ABC-type multidrug transport system ATPase subunit
MNIQLINAGKKFNNDWIFRKANFTFQANKKYAITGANGSGKSTLLQCIAGNTNISEGAIHFQNISAENIFQYIAIAAPYLELIEEMTATEFLEFHSTFKSFIAAYSINQILEKVGLANAANKQIRYFSSGMKQRLKLAQAFFSDVPVLLLDEPCTNLDKNGFDIYHALIQTQTQNRLVIVCSNDEQEIFFCDERLQISHWK